MTSEPEIPDAAIPKDLGDLQNLLGFQLNGAKKLVFDSFVAELAQDGLTPGLFGMLIVVDSHSGINQTKLSALLDFDRSQTVRNLDRLEELNLVKRTRDTRDRRVQIVTIEPTGKRALKRLLEKVREHEEKTARNLTGQERKNLAALLRKLTET